MNARSIKKRLMRGRARVMWGRRAYLTVRLPLSLTGAPPPALAFPGLGNNAFDGSWMSADEKEWVTTHRLTSGGDPDGRELGREGEGVYFIEKTPYDSFEFWTGTHGKRHGDGEDAEVTRTPLSEDVVGQHRARYRWFDALNDEHENPVVNAFILAANWAKSTNWADDGKYLYVTYGVKWFYPNHKLRFCADVARAMRIAKQAGIPARVIK